jgi:hypothetical protein
MSINCVKSTLIKIASKPMFQIKTLISQSKCCCFNILHGSDTDISRICFKVQSPYTFYDTLNNVGASDCNNDRAVTPCTCIRRAPCSNLSRDTDYPE